MNKFYFNPVIFFLSCLTISALAQNFAAAANESCVVYDRNKTYTLAPGETFTTAEFCVHEYTASDGAMPSEIVTMTYECADGWAQEYDRNVTVCPTNEPICYDLDQYADPVNYTVNCLTNETDSSSAAALPIVSPMLWIAGVMLSMLAR
ncbi:expressed unknown protein [Seminavis robusta]|uniref:Uncharacterized protein n=1 Tax=Seminavis robusta TaxID=568900 RepID=A0A9N8H5E3_9STRA|nr:expressed unknown protein [Seminavis robusta]|eukprot:Sro112_g055470.1 n/a (149) ;mRNA; r:1099-1545